MLTRHASGFTQTCVPRPMSRSISRQLTDACSTDWTGLQWPATLPVPPDLRPRTAYPLLTTALRRRATSPNTVQLERGGCDDGWSVGLRPAGVMGAFDVPFDVFAFDDAGVGSVPSGWVEAVGEPVDCLEPEPVRRLRGENRPAGRSRHE